MSHTPGPWRFEIRQEYPNGHVNGIWGPDGEEIIVTDSGFYPPIISDAMLIAAAPDMLDALKSITVDAARATNPSARMFNYDQACAAIAKAEGKQP